MVEENSNTYLMKNISSSSQSTTSKYLVLVQLINIELIREDRLYTKSFVEHSFSLTKRRIVQFFESVFSIRDSALGKSVQRYRKYSPNKFYDPFDKSDLSAEISKHLNAGKI